MADTYYINVAPHNVASPIGTVAAAHVCASIPNFLVIEFHAHDVPWWATSSTASHRSATATSCSVTAPDTA